MFRLIKKLQQKSEAARRQIALGSTLAIMAVIVIVWVTTLSARTPEASEQSEVSVTPFQSFSESFSRLFEQGSTTSAPVADTEDPQLDFNTSAPREATTTPEEEVATSTLLQ